jgi:hypothetical protein
MNFDGGPRAFDPALEAVQEVKVQVNSNSAEYGGAAGASLNIITRAGTNGFHGQVYEYLHRTSAFRSVPQLQEFAVRQPTRSRPHFILIRAGISF